MNVEPSAANDEVNPQRVAEELYPNNSPTFCVPCCTTIPPSPVVFEPDANNTKRSDTSKFCVFWNDAVPCTVISPVNNASLEMVTNAPSSVMLVSANAAPVHFVMVFEDNPADPDT